MSEGNNPKVVVADDSVTIQKVFELAFENEAIDMIIARDGDEALERAVQYKPSMVIADVSMPGLDGFELCAALKRNPSTAQIPVYLMSSALDDFDFDQADKVKAAGRFEKPFRSENMVSEVHKIISADPGQQEDGDDDSFEDIDVQLDSLLETVATDNKQDDDGFDYNIELLEAEIDRPADVEPNDADIEVASDILLDSTGEETPELVDQNNSPRHNRGASFAAARDDTPVDLEKELYDYLESDSNDILEESDIGTEPIDVPDNVVTSTDKIEPGSHMWEEATRKAVEDVISTSYFQTLIEDEVKNVINNKFAGGDFEEAIEKGVGRAINNLQPEILEQINAITRELTLGIAEDMVKKTIEQIKGD